MEPAQDDEAAELEEALLSARSLAEEAGDEDGVAELLEDESLPPIHEQNDFDRLDESSSSDENAGKAAMPLEEAEFDDALDPPVVPIIWSESQDSAFLGSYDDEGENLKQAVETRDIQEHTSESQPEATEVEVTLPKSAFISSELPVSKDESPAASQEHPASKEQPRPSLAVPEEPTSLEDLDEEEELVVATEGIGQRLVESTSPRIDLDHAGDDKEPALESCTEAPPIVDPEGQGPADLQRLGQAAPFTEEEQATVHVHNQAEEDIRSQSAAERAVLERLEQTKEDVKKKVTKLFDDAAAAAADDKGSEEQEEAEDPEKRLRLQEEIVAKEKEARDRLVERLRVAEEKEIKEVRDAEVAARKFQDFYELEDDRAHRNSALITESVWVYKSRWGHKGRRYKPIREQIHWRGIFDGPVQAAFVWDDLFYVAKGDGQIAVTGWGRPWEGEVEEWGPILEGDVQAAWIHMDMVYVVKGGLVASTPWGQDWDGRLEEWGSRIFSGSVQAAFVRGARLYVIKEGMVASETWMRKDWDGSLDDWGPVFPRSMKTAFVCEEDFLYVAREVDS